MSSRLIFPATVPASYDQSLREHCRHALQTGLVEIADAQSPLGWPVKDECGALVDVVAFDKFGNPEGTCGQHARQRQFAAGLHAAVCLESC